MKLNETTRSRIALDRHIKTKISLLTEAHPNTVEYWVLHNKHRSPLINYNVLRLLANYYDCLISDLIEDDEPTLPKIIEK